MTLVRRAGPADGAAVTEVWLRARRAAAHAGTIPPPAHSDQEVREYLTQVAIPDRESWVAVSAGAVVAVMVLDGAWVNQLYVDPDRTGLGIGSALVATAKAARPDGLRLWCFVSNGRARAFYERHGFVVVDETDGSGNEERAPDLLLTWRPSSGLPPMSPCS